MINYERAEDAQSYRYGLRAPVTDRDFQLSRKTPKLKRHGRTADIFVGTQTRHRAVVEGVAVTRLTCVPQSEGVIAPSFAIVNEPAWRATTANSATLSNLNWQQSLPARFDFYFDLPAHIRCYGLGERFSGLNLRGQCHTLVNTDNSKHNETADSMYLSIPLLILFDGDASQAIFLDSPAPQRWHLDVDLDGKGRIELLSRLGWRLYTLGPASLPQLVAAYTNMTGRTPLPPLWALGYQQSRWSYPDEERVREVAHEFRQRQLACDAVVLDIDYMDEFRTFTIAKERFPHFAQMVEDLSREHFNVVAIVDPGIKQDPDYHVFADGVESGAFCRTARHELFIDEVWPGDSVFPDFLKQETRAWWAKHIKFYVDNGVEGLWLDMNEPCFFSKKQVLSRDLEELPPHDEQIFMQQTQVGAVGHLEVRNLYGLLMAMATHEALTALRPDWRPFLLSRAGYSGLQRYAAVWLGDNMSWFQHLGKSVPMLVNMGLSGVPFVGVDIGGFGGDVTPELLVRWYELGMFYPFMRNHCIMDGRAQEPWAFSPETEELIGKLLQARYRLLPYFRALFWEHARTGAPLMRPMAWHFADDESVLDLSDQFMFGSNIMVAPVVESAQTSRNVYFPAGVWHRFSIDKPGPAERIEGPCLRRVHMPLGTIPAFVRDGSILALAAPTQWSQATLEADITFVVYGEKAAGTYFEEDGISRAFENDVYNEWNLNFSAGELTIEKKQQRYVGHQIRYYVHHAGKTKQIDP